MRSLLVAAVLISAVANSVRAADAPSPLTAPFDAMKAKAAQEAWAKHLDMSSPVDKNSIGTELVLIPPGKFTMGSPESEKDRNNAEDQAEVTLTKPFYLGKTEVTQAQWQAVMGTTPWKGKKYVREGDNYSATYVNWDDAQAFCKKLSETEKAAYRLPTEAEWEYACRAGTTTQFSFEDDVSKLSDYAWWGGPDGNVKDELYAHEVGRKKANPFGLHDMHGNVWEWCEDRYADKLAGGTDPWVTAGGSNRVYRGGSWGYGVAYCRSALRGRDQPHDRSDLGGFRLVRSFGK